MRILLTEPDVEDNGALRVSLERAARWAAAGADVTVLFVSGYEGRVAVDIPPGLRTIIANRRKGSARWMLPNVLARGLGPARRADVIVAGREIASGLLVGTLLGWLARRPVAITVHSDVGAALNVHGTPRHRRHVLACLRDAELLVPVSNGLVPELLDLGIKQERVRVVANGLDAERLRLLARHAPEIDMAGDPIVVGLGRLSPEKGFDLLIEAHALALRDGAPRHRLLIVGAGPEQQALIGLAAKLGVSDSVILTGFISNPYSILARADLFVLPSHWEGFSLALAEAVLLGVPSIAADCVAGPREILQGEEYGCLVPVGDAAAIAREMVQYLRDPKPLRKRATAGMASVERRFDAGQAAAAHLDALTRLRDVRLRH